MYKLYAVRVFSLRWSESLKFYRDTVEFPLVFCDEKMGWAQFQLGGAHLGLERCDATDERTKHLVGRFVGISIEVDDIDNSYEKLLAKGVSFEEPPQKQPWGGTLAHFRDPDGNVLTLLGGRH